MELYKELHKLYFMAYNLQYQYLKFVHNRDNIHIHSDTYIVTDAIPLRIHPTIPSTDKIPISPCDWQDLGIQNIDAQATVHPTPKRIFPFQNLDRATTYT
jgi:hypothetical protein